MKRYNLYPDEGHTEDMFRPKFCYADGQLEKDLNGFDYFFMEGSAVELASDLSTKLKNYGYLGEGKYPCQYNGRNATLYVIEVCGHTEGLAAYDDDADSLDYIERWLDDHNSHLSI